MVSYDAINLMRPWSYDQAWGGRAAWCKCSRSLASSWRKPLRSGCADHTDQPATLPQEQIQQEIEEKGGAMAHGFERLYCQGFVNLLATSEATGGTGGPQESSPLGEAGDDGGGGGGRLPRVCG